MRLSYCLGLCSGKKDFPGTTLCSHEMDKYPSQTIIITEVDRFTLFPCLLKRSRGLSLVS